MTETDPDRLEALKRHIAALSMQDYADQVAKTADRQAVFGLIRQGDTVAVACAMREGLPPDLNDAHGMTPLHHAAAHDTRLIAAVLLEAPCAAPWTRDQWDRLPLDVARESGHDALADTLERVTYPGLFRDEVDGPVLPDLIARYDDQRRQLRSPDTRPSFAPEFEARGFLPQRGEQERGDRER